MALNGRVLSLATPVGRYDLAAVAAKLPPDQRPDVVVCLVDASWRNLPSNLAAFSCPKVLLIADTHHLNSPLVGTLRYMAAEPFDRSILIYDRHHAAFFQGTGFRNLFWLPGLTFPHGDAVVHAARVRGSRIARIAFVGQAGKYHPRRTRLLAALQQRNLPVMAKGMGQAENLGFYGASLLGFNASLNGDFNLRVLEIMSVGGALLTDRLAPESGFERLFADQRDCLVYHSSEELAERAAHALAHPAETRAIGEAGARWFDEHYGEARRRELFRAVAFDGVAAPEFEFSPQEVTRVFFGGDTDRLLESLIVYEGIQEIHRAEETVRVQITEAEPDDIKAIFSTLPRCECTTVANDSPADLAVFGRSKMEQGVAFNAPMLWCWNAQPSDFGLLAQGMAPAGYALASDTVALLCQQPLSEATPTANASDPGESGAVERTKVAAENRTPSRADTKTGCAVRLSIGILPDKQAPRLGSLLNSLVHQCARFAGQVEIMVLDDSAEAETAQLVSNYRGRFPISCFRCDPGEGLAGSIRSMVAQRSNGVFTWIIGDGDLLRQDAVEKVLAVIALQPATDFIYTNSFLLPREEFEAKVRGGLVLSDDFPLNGSTQAPVAADGPSLKFDNLIAAVCEEEMRGLVGGAVFRTKVWRNLETASGPSSLVDEALKANYPFGRGFAQTMVGRPAYFLSYPVRITFIGASPRLDRSPRAVLLELPKLLALYAARGISPKQIEQCREAFARYSRASLRTMLLDSTTPGFDEFELRQFIAENHAEAHVILNNLDEVVLEAGLRAVNNRLLDEAKELVRLYPSGRILPAIQIVATTFKSAETFQGSVNRADELLRAGAIREAIAELERAKQAAPNAECAAKAEQVLAMLTSDPQEVPPSATKESPTPPENFFSEGERANIFGIIAAFAAEPSNAEVLSQLHALKHGLADFLRRTEPERVQALFESDFGEIYQTIVALQLGEDSTRPLAGDLTGAVRAGFAAAAGNAGFDPRPLLSHLLYTSNTTRTQKSRVYP